jgi:hypothetical protein
MGVLLALGGACGIAMLAKLNGLAMLMPAGVALIMRSRVHRLGWLASARLLLKMSSWTAAGFAVAAGWYLTVNTVSYGHPLAWDQLQRIGAFAARDMPMAFSQIVVNLPSMLPTVWGSFGFGIGFPALVDQFLNVFVGLVVIGLAIALMRRQAPPGVALLGFASLGATLAFAVWMRSYAFTESARLLAPAASSSAILAALGALAWFPRRLGRPVAAAASAIALLFSSATPSMVIIPAYTIPQALDPARAAALPAAGRVAFDNGIELVQARVIRNRVDQGEALQLILLWRATRQIDDGYVRLIEAIDASGARFRRMDGPPLGGRLSTRYWDLGAVYEETVVVPVIAERGSAPAWATVFVSWHRPRAPYAQVGVVGSTGVSVPVGEIRLRTGAPARDAAARPLAVFGPWAQLERAEISGDEARLVLRATGEPQSNLTLFLHGYDAAGRIIAQSDVPVSPAATVWLAGDEIVFSQRVSGLAGAARIGMGLYDPATGARLTATGPGGARYTDDIVLLR